MLLLAIALLSAAALGYEILLLRLFAIAQWHHLAYMVISLALLGYGVSGTLLTLARRPLLRAFRAAFAGGASLFAVGSIAAFALAQRLPFNLLELFWDPWQLLYLAAGYLLLALPFLGAAGAIGLALAAFGERAGSLYRADLVGAGVGALAIVAALFAVEPETCLRLLGGLGLAAAALVGWARLPAPPAATRVQRVVAAGFGLAALALPAAWPAAWVAPRMSQYKALSQVLRVPGSRVLERRSSPLGRLSVVASPEIPLRLAPGLSLAFTGELPQQLAIFTDGDGPAVIDRWDGGTFPAYFDFLPTAVAYALVERPRALVLDAGGGVGVLAALAHGAPRVDAVDENRQRVELVRDTFGPYAGGLYRRPEVTVHVAEARSFLAQTERRWDLIQLSLGGASGAPGTTALATSYLLTVEGFELLLQHLEPGGVLVVDGAFRPPPRPTLKLFATAVAALEGLGVPHPGDRLALLRDWSTATLLVTHGDLGAADRAVIRSFCERRSFDLAYLPGLTEEEANRFHRVGEPTLHQATRALLGPRRQAFLAAYKFYVEPATEDRPYFRRFFKWRSLPELLRLRRHGGAPLLESGYLALLMVVIQAAVAAVVLILLPLAVLRRRQAGGAGSGRTVVYFFALGLAFLFLEIAFLERLTLVLGHPVYSAALVLGAFLLFAGLGSGYSTRLGDPESRGARLLARLGGQPPVRAAAVAVAALAVLELAPFSSWTSLLLGAPLPLRGLAAVAAIAPLAFLMGMPFPLGLVRTAARRPSWVPWAWGINGCASVLAPPLATLAAVHLGLTAVVLLAAGLYLVAGWALGDG